jgi:hypothetical protein
MQKPVGGGPFRVNFQQYYDIFPAPRMNSEKSLAVHPSRNGASGERFSLKLPISGLAPSRIPGIGQGWRGDRSRK